MPDPLLESAEPLRPIRLDVASDPLADGSDPAEELLAACLALPEHEQARAIDEACSRHPGLASEVRSRVAALRAMGIELGNDFDFPEQLGDFRLIEVLGGGGMGVVYLAVQTSLQRDVALKVIRPEHLFFAGSRARFRREAEAVARLQHPGIVPIYAIGEDKGVPYFAMELVRGCTLAEALRALRGRAPESLGGKELFDLVAHGAASNEPMQEGSTYDGTWIEAAVRIARAVADALQHAHERGLVHRDVKPSNIALTPDGRAMLLDFGLTRADDGADMTRAGSALGTLHYMSPEQVRGARNVDARTDVYSLGITLYEMLALQVPFRGEDEAATERLVLDGRADPIRPRNRRVEADLETVITCAIDPDPARRYSSSADFARDLGHWLAHRPIEARRPGALLRTRRWVQRHPAIGTAVFVGPTLVIVGAIALFVREKQHSHELSLALSDTRLAYESAQRESTRANREADTAKRALDFVVGMFAPKSSATSAHREVSSDFMTGPQMFAHGERKLETELAGDVQGQARMYTTIGHVFANQGAHERALEVYEKACALWSAEDAREVGPYFADTLTLRAEALSSLGRNDEACTYLRQALHLWPDGPEWALGRMRTFDDLVRLDVGRTSSEELVNRARKALEEELARSQPDPIAVGRCRSILGKALMCASRMDEAAVELQAAFEVLVHPDSPPDRDTIVLVSNLAQAFEKQGRFNEAQEINARALSMARAQYPIGSELLGLVLYGKGQIEVDRGDMEAAFRSFDEAASMLREHAGPSHPETLAADSELALVARYLKRYSDAEDAACRVVDDTRDLENRRGMVGRALAVLARCAEASGDTRVAVERWREAICYMRLDPSLANELERALVNLARLRFAAGSVDEARGLLLSTMDIMNDQREEFPPYVVDALAHICRVSGRAAEADSYEAWLAEQPARGH